MHFCLPPSEIKNPWPQNNNAFDGKSAVITCMNRKPYRLSTATKWDIWPALIVHSENLQMHQDVEDSTVPPTSPIYPPPPLLFYSLPQLIKDLSDYVFLLSPSLSFFSPLSSLLLLVSFHVKSLEWNHCPVRSPLTSSPPVCSLFFCPPMIKRFSAQGGTSIGLLKDRVITTSELYLQRGESH